MTKKIIIAGNYGFHNMGDEAILSSILSGLSSKNKDLEYCVVSNDPKQTMLDFHVNSISWLDINSIIDHVRQSDLVILGGGGIFNDYWGVIPENILTKEHAGISFYSEFAMLAKLLNKPFMIYAVGIGPLKTQEGQDLTSFSFNQAQISTLRDIESKKILDEFDCQMDNISVTADPAFCLNSDIDQAKLILSGFTIENDLPRVAICLRNWDINIDQQNWQRKIAQCLDNFYESHRCQFIFIPFHNLPEYPLTDDIAAADTVVSSMKHHKETIILRESYSPELISGIISQSDLLIGMRLHSIIFAANSNIPMVGVIYDPKVSHLLLQLGMESYGIDLNKLTEQNLSLVIDNAWAERSKTKRILTKKVKLMQQLAEKNSDIALTLLKDEVIISSTQQTDEYLKWFALKQSQLLLKEVNQSEELENNLHNKENENLDLVTELSEKEKIISNLNNEIKRKIEIIIQLQSQFQKKQITVDNLQRKLQQNIKTIETLNNLTNDKEQIVRELNEHLNMIARSRGWKLLLRCWDLRLRIAPHGSWREKALKWVWHFPRSIFQITTIKSFLKPPRLFQDKYIEYDNSIVTLFSDSSEIKPEYLNRSPLSSIRPDNLKVSLIASIKNELDNIEQWLQDIKSQTRQPDEITIVDGGSTDGSYEMLLSKVNHFSIPIKIIQVNGANRSKGRNVAIENSTHPLIAVTDFGCHIDTNWLNNIIKPFLIDPEICVSAGFYRCINRNNSDSSQNDLWANLQTTHPQYFLPSSRSVAFSRTALESIGGYPEWLFTTGEDTYLDLELKRLGGKWAFVPEAFVEWHAPISIESSFRKNYQWAVGDGETGIRARYYWRYVLRLSLWAIFSLISLAIIMLSIFLPLTPVVLWSGIVVVIYLAAAFFAAHKAELTLPLLVQRMIGEFAQILGFIKGASNSLEVEHRKNAQLIGTIFILAGVPIDDTGGGSRGAQIANEFLRQGYAVIYINKFPSYESRDLNLKYVHPNLYLFQSSNFSFENFQKSHPELLIKKNLGAILEFPLSDFIPIIEWVKANDGKVVYDLLDDWQTSLGGDWYSIENEIKIINACDKLIATVPNLGERLENISNRPVALVPNAVNNRLFNSSIVYKRPDDLPEAKHIIIYTGALWGNWFDWDLLVKISKTYADSLVCVIGDYRGQISKPPHNLIFLGLKAQSDLPAYLAFSDVAIIPWKTSNITQNTSPLKIYEYLAMGCPVIAPVLQPLLNIPGVFLAKDQSDFIDLLMKVDRSVLDQQEIEEFIHQNNWKNRVEQIKRLLGFTNERIE